MNIDHRDALISQDGRYRYHLTRRWDGAKATLNIVGLNPSTADHKLDDATLRRCIHFAHREGYGGLVLTNLFAFRARDPNEMKRAADPVGPENDEYLLKVANSCGAVLLAWGGHGTYRGRNDQVLKLLDRVCQCLGTTKHGQPRHPLYLPKDQPATAFHRR